MPKIYTTDLKLSVINFYNSDLFTIENCTNIFNISKSSLYNWVNLNFQYTPNVRKPYCSKINNTVQKYIIEYVTKKIVFTIKKLRKCIKNVFNILVSKSSIYRILKKFNITNKRISQKIIPKNTNINGKVNELLKNVNLCGINNIVSIDECSFDTHMCPKYGWSKRGSLIKKTINIPKKVRKTLTLAVTNKKIIGYSLINGSSNTIIFNDFLNKNILPNIKNHTLLMDNVAFHHSKIVINSINSTSNKILYNVPYNPNTNPIEFVFSILKNFVRKMEPSTEINLDKCIVKSFKLITKKKLNNIFDHSLNS